MKNGDNYESKENSFNCQQVFSERLIYREFFTTCSSMCLSIKRYPDSPWTYNKDPIPFWYQHGQRKIGKIQRAIIKFLHEKYFQFGKPVYLKTSNIAKAIGTDRTRIAHSITALVKRGILIRIGFTYRKCNRSLLLPSLPDIKTLLQKWLTPSFFAKLENVTGGCDILFQNLPKKLKKQSSLIYTQIQYIYETMKDNLTVIIHKFMKNSNVRLLRSGVCAANAESGNPESIKKEKPMLESKPTRFVLHNQSTPPLPQPQSAFLIDLKTKGFENLNVYQKNLLIETIDFHYGIESRNLFPYNLKYRYKEAQYTDNKYRVVRLIEDKIFKMLLDLYCDGIKINWHLTDRVCTHWNESITEELNKHITRIKTRPVTKNYRLLGIVLTHLINYSLERDMNRLLTAIDRLMDYSWYIPKIFKNKKANILHFFIDPWEDRNDYLDGFFEKDPMKFQSFIYYYKPTYKEAFDKFKSMFIETIYNDNPNKGNEIFSRWHNYLSRWFDEMSSQILNSRGTKRDLCDLRWIAPNKKHNLNAIVQEYLIWLTTINFRPHPKDVGNVLNWQNFVMNRMRSEYGFTNFWKYIK